jgi:hypothetical protein
MKISQEIFNVEYESVMYLRIDEDSNSNDFKYFFLANSEWNITRNHILFHICSK